MAKFRVPNTYVIIFFVLLLCAASTWFVPGSVPQTWQVFSALYEGFSQQAGIIAFVLIIGGAFWLVNSTKAVDVGIMKFMTKARGNLVMVLIMLLFGLFGAVFGMSEETIAFVAVAIPLARSLGYDEIVAVCMVYVAAHVGFAGAMLNPFTVGIAQSIAEVPLFSGVEYRTLAWVIATTVGIIFLLIYAIKEVHNYSFKKTVGSVFIIIFGMVMLVLIGLLVYSFMGQLIDFLVSIVKEVFYRAF